MSYPGIVLRPEQDQLLKALVEADRAANPRGEFFATRSMGSLLSNIHHRGLADGFEAFDGDILELSRLELIAFRPNATELPPSGAFDVTGLGLQYYDVVLKSEAENT